MNTRFLSLLGLALLVPVVSLQAQQEPEAVPQTEIALRTPEQLNELLGPIALFPDPLIAIILPAAASSSDIILAARFLDAGGDPAATDDQPWDPSVRSLAHYREVVDWLDEHLAWTIQVGEAFIVQPEDVMDAIQRLRALARAAGTLTDTPEQRVVVESEKIHIVAAQPEVIYVPVYDPEVVYVRQPVYVGRPYITFGMGFSIGHWLSYDCDWHHRRIWIGTHYRPWPEYRAWRHPQYVVQPGHYRDPLWRPWRPPVVRVRHHNAGYGHPRPHHIERPSPFSRDRYEHRRGDRSSPGRPGADRDRSRNVDRAAGTDSPRDPNVSGGSHARRDGVDTRRGGVIPRDPNSETRPERGDVRRDPRGQTPPRRDNGVRPPRASPGAPPVRVETPPAVAAPTAPATPAPPASRSIAPDRQHPTPRGAGGSRVRNPEYPSRGGPPPAVRSNPPTPRTTPPAVQPARPSRPQPPRQVAPSSPPANRSAPPSSRQVTRTPSPPPPSASAPAPAPRSEPAARSGSSRGSSGSPRSDTGSRNNTNAN